MGGCGSKPKTIEVDVQEVPQTGGTVPSEVTPVAVETTCEVVPETSENAVEEAKEEATEDVVAEVTELKGVAEVEVVAEENKDEQDKEAEPEKTEEKPTEI